MHILHVLDPLPFGDDSRKLLVGLASAAEAMAKVVPTVRVYEARRDKIFRSKSAYIQIGDMKIFSNSSDPCVAEVDESDGWYLLVPHNGRSKLTTDDCSYEIEPGKMCILFPNLRRRTEKPKGGFTLISINYEKVTHVINILQNGKSSELQICNNPHLIDNSFRPSLSYSFLQILSIVNTFCDNDKIFNYFCIDELIYRWIALGLTLNVEELPFEKGEGVRFRVDSVCDAIRASTSRPLTLTEMGEFAGVSGRHLQNAFKSRFNCSPMQWQRRERMLTARQRILTAAPDETLTEICFSMSFSSLAAFGTMYKIYFDEAPSVTQKKR